MKAINLLAKFSEVQETAKLLHLGSSSYSEHKALGEFYETWTGLVDDFMETLAGTREKVAGEYFITVTSAVNASDYLATVRAYLQVDAMGYINQDLDKDLENILAEMLGAVNRTIYLLTLK